MCKKTNCHKIERNSKSAELILQNLYQAKSTVSIV